MQRKINTFIVLASVAMLSSCCCWQKDPEDSPGAPAVQETTPGAAGTSNSNRS